VIWVSHERNETDDSRDRVVRACAEEQSAICNKE